MIDLVSFLIMAAPSAPAIALGPTWPRRRNGIEQLLSEGRIGELVQRPFRGNNLDDLLAERRPHDPAEQVVGRRNLNGLPA